ncbi:inorganic diphosphatase [Mycoplasmopsis felis]|uniref:inorganic diphosphatase n=1 Tax=Mycoplasmopsis felis TaxID=33923 RepID=UPI0021B06C44|nr:inorganic diphosphatase [Mycoplasmopsis felis]UWV84934.1 inorganic diphosphatase [Mycoplasmopsis felis]
MKKIDVKIEIQKNSKIKYEYNRKTKEIEVDRILRGDFVYPCDYGFIKCTRLRWRWIRCFIIFFRNISIGVKLSARIIGAMKMIDDGETDTKLICVRADDYRLDNIQSLSDLPSEFLEKVKTFSQHTKTENV